MIQPGEDREFILSDNEGVSSQLSEDHAEKEEIDTEETTEMNSESESSSASAAIRGLSSQAYLGSIL